MAGEINFHFDIDGGNFTSAGEASVRIIPPKSIVAITISCGSTFGTKCLNILLPFSFSFN